MDALGSVAATTASADTVRNAPYGAGPTPAAGARPAAQDVPDGQAATSERLKAAVAAANRQLEQTNREMTFVFDDRLGRMLVKIVDTSTNAVVRQVPSEDMLAAARALSQGRTRGALVNSKA